MNRYISYLALTALLISVDHRVTAEPNEPTARAVDHNSVSKVSKPMASADALDRIETALQRRTPEGLKEVEEFATNHKSPAVRSAAWVAHGILRYERAVSEPEKERVLKSILEEKTSDPCHWETKSWAARALMARGHMEFTNAAREALSQLYSDQSYVERMLEPAIEQGSLVKAHGSSQAAYQKALDSKHWEVQKWGLERLGFNQADRLVKLSEIFEKINQRFDSETKRVGPKRGVLRMSENEKKTYSFVVSELKGLGRDVLKENSARVRLLNIK